MQDTFPMTLGTTFMRRFLWCRKIKSLGKNPRECICGQRTEMLVCMCSIRGLKSFINTTHLGNGPWCPHPPLSNGLHDPYIYYSSSSSMVSNALTWAISFPSIVCSLFRSAPSQCPSFRHTREKGFGPHDEEEWEGGIFLIEKLLSLFYSEAHHNFHDGDWNVSVKKWGLTSFLVHKLLNSEENSIWIDWNGTLMINSQNVYVKVCLPTYLRGASLIQVWTLDTPSHVMCPMYDSC